MFATLGVVGSFVGMIALSGAHSAINQLSDLRAQIESLRERLPEASL